jgi:hypothetical protein
MLVISDLHWRCDTPAWRKESDYAKQVLRPQLASLLDTGEPVIVAGDVFHRSADFAATYDLFTFLKERGAVLYATRGQHDMTYHNESMARTGVNLLAAAGLIVPLTDAATEIEGHHVFGMGWGEQIPNPPGVGQPLTLIAHVSVSHGDAVIPGATTATAFRQKAKGFKLVFTGDNHRRFSLPDTEASGLYNAGCFHQMSADLINQPPAAWHVLPDGSVELFQIPFTPPMIDESYALSKHKGKAVAGAEFVKALAEARNQGSADIFMNTLRAAAGEASGETKVLLNECIKKCEESHT